MNPSPANDVMFTVVPIFIGAGFVLLVVLLILNLTTRTKRGGEMRRSNLDQPHNPLLDPGNPASPLFPNQFSNTPGPIDVPSPPSTDSGSGHSGHGGHH